MLTGLIAEDERSSIDQSDPPVIEHPPSRIERVKWRLADAWASLDATRLDRRIPGTLVVAALATLVGAVACYFSFRNGSNLLYSDAQSHLTIARRVLDNKSPGFPQLGTVWLPAPHLLLLPFVQNFWLWQNGLAAAILGVGCLTASTVSLYRITARMGLARGAKLVVVAVFLCNPTVLYLHTTALTEPVLLAAMLVMLSALATWITSTQPYSGGELAIFAGVPAGIAVLSRYDGWAMALAAGGFVVVASWRRWRSPTYSLKMAACFASVPTCAILWWISYNWVRFGDPLEFMRGPYSAETQQEALAQIGLLPTRGNLGLALSTYNWTVLEVVGAGVIALASVGLLILIFARGLSTTALIVWTLAVFYPFSVLSLYLGQTAIRNDHSLPAGLFNIRFSVSMVPLAALLIGIAVDEARKREGWRLVAIPVVVAVLVGSSLWWWSDSTQRIPVLAEGHRNQDQSTDAIRAAQWLGDHYTGGDILIDDGANPLLMQLHQPLSQVYATFTGDQFDEALADPQTHAKWILVDADSTNDKVWRAVKDQPLFDLNYAQVFTAGKYRVYERVGP